MRLEFTPRAPSRLPVFANYQRTRFCANRRKNPKSIGSFFLLPFPLSTINSHLSTFPGHPPAHAAPAAAPTPSILAQNFFPSNFSVFFRSFAFFPSFARNFPSSVLGNSDRPSLVKSPPTCSLSHGHTHSPLPFRAFCEICGQSPACLSCSFVAISFFFPIRNSG
jgi:hypothetical protein